MYKILFLTLFAVGGCNYILREQEPAEIQNHNSFLYEYCEGLNCNDKKDIIIEELSPEIKMTYKNDNKKIENIINQKPKLDEKSRKIILEERLAKLIKD